MKEGQSRFHSIGEPVPILIARNKPMIPPQEKNAVKKRFQSKEFLEVNTESIGLLCRNFMLNMIPAKTKPNGISKRDKVKLRSAPSGTFINEYPRKLTDKASVTSCPITRERKAIPTVVKYIPTFSLLPEPCFRKLIYY